MAGWISEYRGSWETSLIGREPLVRDPAGDVLADFHADPVRAQQFLALQDTRRMYFRSRSIRNNAQQRPCVRRNAVEVMMSTSLLRSSVALVFSLTAWRNISCSIFFWACSCSRVLDDDAGLARKGREHLDVRLGEDEFLRGGIALQDPMISPLIFSGMEMLEVRRQIRSILKSNSVMTELLQASRM